MWPSLPCTEAGSLNVTLDRQFAAIALLELCTLLVCAALICMDLYALVLCVALCGVVYTSQF